MKKTALRKEIKRKDPAPAVTKAGLVLMLAVGFVFLFLGIRGQRIYNESGFTSENAFTAIYALSGDVDKAWNQSLKPEVRMAAVSEQTSLEQAAEELLLTAWDNQKSGAGAELSGTLSASNDRDGLKWRLLYTVYLVNGPKVSTANRKEICSVDEEMAAQFRKGVLESILDESLPVPAEAEKTVGNLTGLERQAMLMQVFFISSGSTDGKITEDVNLLKKSVRDKGQQLTAFDMIARGELSWLQRVIVGSGRTVTLIGVVVIFDVVLLFLLMLADKSWIMDVKWLLILLILDFLLFFQLLPVIYMLVKAFFPEGTFSLETFKRLYTYTPNLEALKNTLISAFATMILGTALAFPLAWLVGRTNLYGRKFFRFLFVLTYMVPPYVGAMAWLRLMNPNVGTVNQWLRLLFGLNDAPGPLNVYTLPGVIWVLTTFYYPYAFITISRAMEKMDPSLEEASRISGASPLKTVFTVTIPIMTPSLIAGALLVFISAASCYGIPSIIGINGNVNTITTRIVEYTGKGQQGLNDATALSVFLLITALIILFISDVMLARKQYITVSGKSVRPAIVDLRSWRVPLTVLVSIFSLIVVVIPFGTILFTSFKVDVGKSVLDANNFTLSNWTSIFSGNETLVCLRNSLIYASIAATVGLVIACVMSYLLQRTRIRGRELPNFLITLGSGTPSVVIALGLIMTMRGTFGVDIYNTAMILIIAYLIKYLMMGMRTVVSAMSQIHVSLEECSQVSGASWFRTMRRITGPLIMPSIAAGWFLIFIPSFYELSMTTLLYSSSTKTVGLQLYEYWSINSQPMSCAMAFGILLIVVVLNLLLNRLSKGEFSI